MAVLKIWKICAKSQQDVKPPTKYHQQTEKFTWKIRVTAVHGAGKKAFLGGEMGSALQVNIPRYYLNIPCTSKKGKISAVVLGKKHSSGRLGAQRRWWRDWGPSPPPIQRHSRGRGSAGMSLHRQKSLCPRSFRPSGAFDTTPLGGGFKPLVDKRAGAPTHRPSSMKDDWGKVWGWEKAAD